LLDSLLQEMKANPYILILYIGFKLLFVSSSSLEQRENDSERVISLDTLRSSIKDLGLSESDIAEIQEFSDTAITRKEIKNLKNFLDDVTEEELEKYTEMSPDELEEVYMNKIDSYNSPEQTKRSATNHKPKNLLVNDIGGEIIEENEEDRENVNKNSIANKNKLECINKIIGDMSVEEIEKLSQFEPQELEQYFMDDVIAHEESTKDDEENQQYFNEVDLHISHTRLRREASPDPEPEAEPEAEADPEAEAEPMTPYRKRNSYRSRSDNERQKQYLEKYASWYRSRGKRAIQLSLGASFKSAKTRSYGRRGGVIGGYNGGYGGGYADYGSYGGGYADYGAFGGYNGGNYGHHGSFGASGFMQGSIGFSGFHKNNRRYGRSVLENN